MSTNERPAWLGYHKNRWKKRTEYVHPGWKPAEHEHGVVMMAPWDDPYAGFPEHVRRLARSLSLAGQPLRLRAIRGSADPTAKSKDLQRWRDGKRLREEYVDLLRASIRDVDAEIWMTIPDDAAFMHLAPPLGAHRWMDPTQHAYALSRRVISTVFERDRVSPQAAAALSRVAQVWVANHADRQMLLEQTELGEDRIIRVPLPYMPDEPLLDLRGRKRMPGRPRFYHIGKWEPRKEQRNILLAFMLAFEPGDASLYLKTSLWGPKLTSDYPRDPQRAVHAVLDRKMVKARGWTLDNVNKSIFLIQRRLTFGQLRDLHRQGDVYVSLSRGEGWDMPAYDACLAGNGLVYTASGGPQDFAHCARASYQVALTGKVPCDPFYRWGEACYHDYDVDEAVQAMRMAAASVGKHKPPPMDETLSAASAGAIMRQALERMEIK